MSSQNLLFLCSGNYYRSRVAEAVFNHLAVIDPMEWRAFSRGFKPKPKEMELSPEARDYLANQRIPLSLTAPYPQKLETGDLAKSSIVVAVYESDHRPKLLKQFPLWENRVIYWNIADIDERPAEEALPDLAKKVRGLYNGIKDGAAPGCGAGLEF